VAGSSYAQMVRELGEAVSVFATRVGFAEKEIVRLDTTLTKTIEALQVLDKRLHDIDKRLVLVEHQLTELCSGRKE
jgi:hypothetical protein